MKIFIKNFKLVFCEKMVQLIHRYYSKNTLLHNYKNVLSTIHTLYKPLLIN